MEKTQTAERYLKEATNSEGVVLIEDAKKYAELSIEEKAGIIPIKCLFTLPKEQRKFIEEYLDMVNSFQFHIETYGIEKGFVAEERNNLAIKNTDLWIEAYIDIFPQLQEFRDYVRNEMERLGIERHPDFAYRKDGNHYYYSHKRIIEELSTLLKEVRI